MGTRLTRPSGQAGPSATAIWRQWKLGGRRRRRSQAWTDLGRRGFDYFGQRRGGLRPGGRSDLRRGRGRSELAGLDDFLHLGTFQCFVFEQTIGDDFELVAVLIDDGSGDFVSLVDD